MKRLSERRWMEMREHGVVVMHTWCSKISRQSFGCWQFVTQNGWAKKNPLFSIRTYNSFINVKAFELTRDVMQANLILIAATKRSIVRSLGKVKRINWVIVRPCSWYVTVNLHQICIRASRSLHFDRCRRFSLTLLNLFLFENRFENFNIKDFDSKWRVSWIFCR